MATQNELRKEITDRIVESLENGVTPWRKPWVNDPNAGIPANVVSKQKYRGINSILLGLLSIDFGFDSRWWGTFRQWKALGGSVKRGEQGTHIVFFKPIKREKDTGDDETEEVTVHLMRTYTVFNAQQTTLEEFHVNHSENRGTTHAAFDHAEAVVAATKADIRFGGNRACYYPSNDTIQMPHKGQFAALSEYFETLFHELCHWSERRLNWTATYAMNELVAEMGACFLATEIGIPQSENLENHAAYLSSWLSAMQDDPKWIFKASTQASKASDFILSFSQKEQFATADEIPF